MTAPRWWRRHASCGIQRFRWLRNARASRHDRPEMGGGIVSVSNRKYGLAALLASLAALLVMWAGAVRQAEATPPRQNGAPTPSPTFQIPPTNTPRPTFTPEPTAAAS